MTDNRPVYYDEDAPALNYDANGTPVPVPSVAPTGGATGEVLTKDSGTDFDYSWQSPGGGSLPVGGSTNQVLAKLSGTNFDCDWVNASGGSFPAQIVNLIYINLHSSTEINISAYDGQWAQLADGPCELPAQPFRIDNTGLLASTLYYLYGYRDSGTNKLAAEWSTTYHTFDSSTGLEVKLGDNSRILLGMVYTNASAQFVDTATQRFVASWPAHNREPLPVWASLPSNQNITGDGNWHAIPGLKVEGLSWGYGWHAEARGSYGHSTTASEVLMAIQSTQVIANSGGTSTVIHDMGHREAPKAANSATPWSCGAYFFFLECRYTIEVLALATAGTLTIANLANADGKRSGMGVYATNG